MGVVFQLEGLERAGLSRGWSSKGMVFQGDSLLRDSLSRG